MDTVGDGIPDWWRALYFGGDGRTTNPLSSATADPTGSGHNNLFKFTADLDPTNRDSRLAFIAIGIATNDVTLTWIGGTSAWQFLECSPNLVSNDWTTILTNAPPTPVTNTISDTGAATGSKLFYRVKARR